MKKLLCIFIAIVSISFLSSCTTNFSKKNPDGSPTWTTERPKSISSFYGVGKAKFTIPANSEKAAEMNAKAELAKQIDVEMKEFVSQYANETSEGNAVIVYENLLMEIVSVHMKGIKSEAKWIAPDGTTWCLVSISKSEVKNIQNELSEEIKKR